MADAHGKASLSAGSSTFGGYAYDPLTVSYMAFNFLASVLIVFVNKSLFGTFGFSYSTFVTMMHFVITFLGTLLCWKLKVFEHKPLRQLDVLPITIAFCGFVVFNNLSLQYNSVGFYQLMKVMTTPVIVALQYMLYGVKEDSRLILSLVPVIVGVALATLNDFSMNFIGTVYAVLGIVATSLYQIFVKSKQDSLGANSWQLLLYQAPQAAVVVFFLVPVFDNVSTGEKNLLAYLSNPSFNAMTVLFISCCLAFCVNLSIYLVVGKTSPVTYNVLGHFKLLVILFGGLVFQGEDSNPLRLIGMALAFAGIVDYTNAKQSIANTWKTQQSKPTSVAPEDNADPESSEPMKS